MADTSPLDHLERFAERRRGRHLPTNVMVDTTYMDPDDDWDLIVDVAERVAAPEAPVLDIEDLDADTVDGASIVIDLTGLTRRDRHEFIQEYHDELLMARHRQLSFLMVADEFSKWSEHLLEVRVGCSKYGHLYARRLRFEPFSDSVFEEPLDPSG